jgi:hypothetical protein
MNMIEIRSLGVLFVLAVMAFFWWMGAIHP